MRATATEHVFVVSVVTVAEVVPEEKRFRGAGYPLRSPNALWLVWRGAGPRRSELPPWFGERVAGLSGARNARRDRSGRDRRIAGLPGGRKGIASSAEVPQPIRSLTGRRTTVGGGRSRSARVAWKDRSDGDDCVNVVDGWSA